MTRTYRSNQDESSVLRPDGSFSAWRYMWLTKAPAITLALAGAGVVVWLLGGHDGYVYFRLLLLAAAGVSLYDQQSRRYKFPVAYAQFRLSRAGSYTTGLAWSLLLVGGIALVGALAMAASGAWFATVVLAVVAAASLAGGVSLRRRQRRHHAR